MKGMKFFLLHYLHVLHGKKNQRPKPLQVRNAITASYLLLYRGSKKWGIASLCFSFLFKGITFILNYELTLNLKLE